MLARVAIAAWVVSSALGLVLLRPQRLGPEGPVGAHMVTWAANLEACVEVIVARSDGAVLDGEDEHRATMLERHGLRGLAARLR